jgi:hypothetical protein
VTPHSGRPARTWYTSAESGRFEVYARPFPNTEDAKWQVSNRGGSMPRWAATVRQNLGMESGQDLVVVENVFEVLREQVPRRR